ncbi:class I SAM-dependent methyltransferase [Microbacterium protaetiae]|uniref:Class I SAM-dependent methyltransferase n=1 Tax=Microbacterium protaetiae TaxID=2509458 RepID=A0A4P6EL80_9MICO|nr:class I SAM-dependent methyltransferase [Microbacterium protaetiae]QAY60957.1 class I SAM-dependent methyltransferase [Microbacterium protaetiae]
MATREEMSRSFGGAADVYETGRPQYPAEAVEWMLQPVRGADGLVRVADVGAGTGKLTRALVDAGAQVVAADPDAAMLAALRGGLPGVTTYVGTGESLPLPDAAFDAVVFGQAWHWVDPVAASAEVGRVLRHGGVLGLVWNIRDTDVPWVVELGEIMHGSNAEIMMAEGGPEVSAPFDGLESRSWRWARPMTREQLFDMAHSRSYVITAEPTERERIDRELGALFDRIGAVGDAPVDLPYVTTAFRALRP